MSSQRLTTLIVTLTALVLIGCTTPPPRELSRELPRNVRLPNGYNPLNPDQLVPASMPGDVDIAQGAIPYFERVHGHPLNILEISGGGQNGAFGAGFLKGWRESGTRPPFDIVTGVSTGALLATHAFLGTPADDATLEEIFTTITAQNVYESKGLLNVLVEDSSSVYDTSPLAAYIAKYITAEVLIRVAAAYDDNRRLWVGTTNLDYNQTWVWNMTGIAKEGGPDALELYRKVLRASASPPVAFPPVEIDGHLFGDGGVRENVVVVGFAGEEEPKPPLHGPGDVFLIHNGYGNAPPHAITANIAGISGTTIGMMFDNAMESIVLRAYWATIARGYKFHYVEIPEGVDIGHNMLAFDPKQMRNGFDAGRAMAKKPDPWSNTPPMLGDFPPWVLKAIQNPSAVNK